MKTIHAASASRAQPRTLAASKQTPQTSTDGAAHSRRSLLAVAGTCAVDVSVPEEAQAVQGLTAGRIPGLSPDPELPNVQVYVRPDGKSGGHGVGWSEIPQYQFRVPETWGEVPVSIADLGGANLCFHLKFAVYNWIPVMRHADETPFSTAAPVCGN